MVATILLFAAASLLSLRADPVPQAPGEREGRSWSGTRVGRGEGNSEENPSGRRAAGGEAPCPPSPVFAGIDWAPLSSVTRRALGSDNWPLTWADDGHLYTAYGDGRGFEPFRERKLSMGFARVIGGAAEFRGINLPSPTGDTTGGGPAGRKASGILSVDGVLYLWARNARNSQLAHSGDHGRTWTWCRWKFTTSFGAPTFLQFGRDYGGARDRFVYVYSFDSDDAYTAADRMVLARVDRERILEREAYDFFVGVGPDGEPRWSDDIRKRGPVFKHANQCYRSGVSYHAPSGRYLWVQVLPGAPDRAHRTRERDPRFQGGFGVYDAAEPWGPWTTVFFTPRWDTGPGESASLPPKWISGDGETIHLVFSGEDCFSVRRGRLKRRAR